MAEEMAEPTLTLDELLKFFEERIPVLNVTPIGEEAGLAQGHLNRILKGERGLTQVTLTKLLPVLRKYGYQTTEVFLPTTLTLAEFQQFLSERKRSINITFLAEEIGISKGHLSKVIAGTKGFTQKTAAKLLAVLPKYGYVG